jgi:CRP-like cAMP-binding protein
VPEIKVNHGQTLAKVPIFSGLAEAELSFLALRAVPRHFAAGKTVFGEGEPCAGLYVVEAGHIRIFKSAASGREQVLSIDGPGSSVAELPVFDGGNYPASAVAIDDVMLLFVSKQDFQALCLAHPQVALKVLRVLVLACGGLSALSRNFHSPPSATGSRPSYCVSPKRKASALLRGWKSP